MRSLVLKVNWNISLTQTTRESKFKSELYGIKRRNQKIHVFSKLGKRSTLHVSDQCFALFGVSLAFQEESVYRNILNDGILSLQASGLIDKVLNDVKWDMLRSETGTLLQVSRGKALKIVTQAERCLTLVDTEGMFLLLGIGFVIAGGVLISEWV